jgi:hypothetical protein
MSSCNSSNGSSSGSEANKVSANNSTEQVVPQNDSESKPIVVTEVKKSQVKYKGVCFNKPSKSYLAQIGKNGHQLCLGYFRTAEAAALAYDKKCREMFGDDCITNFSLEKYNELLESFGGVIKSNGERKHESKTSKYRGVSYHKPSHSWQSRFYNDSKDIHLGYFPTSEEAAMAYDKKAFSLLGSRARLNFPSRAVNNTAATQAEGEVQNINSIDTSKKDDLILFKIASGLVDEFEKTPTAATTTKKPSRKKSKKDSILNQTLFGGAAESSIGSAVVPSVFNADINRNNNDIVSVDTKRNNKRESIPLSMLPQPYDSFQSINSSKRGRYHSFLSISEQYPEYDRFTVGYNPPIIPNSYQYFDLMNSFMRNINK